MRRSMPSLVLYAAVALVLQACSGEAGPRDGSDAAEASAASGAQASSSGKMDLSNLGYAKGRPDAPVTVVEFSDFGCPYCAKFALETLPELQREFVESGQVRWQYVPFELGMFPNGAEAARAGECAGEQGRFWEMHDLLYERQGEWKSSDAPEALLAGFAREVGLDARRFAGCYRENRPGPRIQRHNRVAEQLGVRATPSFLVNGRPVEGALPLDQFRMLLHWAGAKPATP